MTILCMIILYLHLIIGLVFKRFMSQTPYLVHESTKTPHITSSRVLLVEESLKCEELNRLSWKSGCILTSGAVHLTGILPPRET